MKRGRNQRRRQGANPNRALDSNRPEVRIRGTANQIYDKYIALARDASSAGDRIKAESYLQHAEHYFRMIRAMQPAHPPQSQVDADSDQPSFGDSDDDDNNNADDRRRPQRRQRDGGRDEAEAGADQRDAASDENDDSDAGGDDEGKGAGSDRKPRRRRAPRKSVKTAEEDADAPAAAE